MTEPRVSVVTPFFNAGKYLEEAIESVLAQRNCEFELLLVDDGSTDASSVIARDYAAREIGTVRYFEHPGHANLGATISRNLGLRHARGDLIAFLDADDCWRPDKLQEQAALLDCMPDVDAVCGAVNFWGSHNGGQDTVVASGHVINRPVAAPEALLRVYPLGRADPPCPSDLMMRRSALDRVGGFEEGFTGPLQLYEDQAFLAKLFVHGTVFFSDRVWLDYRLHDESCTATVNRAGLQPEVRHYFLNWFERYLTSTRFRHDPRVRWALFKALRPYRHPKIWAAGRTLKRSLQRRRPFATPIEAVAPDCG